ncbi:MAG TPA: TonB-dependent receptor plug domain-containing protein, partial [Candidatus Eremiobacteraceae bacterium]|nr:TonB-dependent receptor plug domain-containing protein [Candidatus Eremiobacteraceae bacterium]
MLLAASAAALAVALCGVAPARADAPSGSVTVTVSTTDGKPIAGAVITLAEKAQALSARGDAQGVARFEAVAAGTWLISATAASFAPLGGRTIDVLSGTATAVSLQLVRTASSLVVLGHVTTVAGEALSTSSVPTQTIDAQTAAAQGVTSVADAIADDAISTMVNRPVSGSPVAPSVVALRGPDPTETLIDLDGHSLNSGGTGAFDLSLIDPAELSDVQLVYGISPSSLVGPNTIDGAINIRTLDPTATDSGLIRLELGSFDMAGETLQATGTSDGAGYALSVHKTTTDGEVSDQGVDVAGGGTAFVGSAMDGGTELGKLRVPLDRGTGYAQLTLLGQNDYRDLSAALTSLTNPGGSPLLYDSFAGSSLQAHTAGYAFDLQMPLGSPDAEGITKTTVIARHYASVADQSVFGPAASTTLFLYNDRDSLQDDSVEIDQAIAAATLSAKFEIRNEDLNTEEYVGGAVDEGVDQSPLSQPLGAAEG